MYKQPLALLLIVCLCLTFAAPVSAADEPLELPGHFVFTLDPFEKAGRGQIYADPLRVINRGADEMEVEIVDLVCEFSDSDIRNVDEVDLFALGDKAIRLALRRTDRAIGENEPSQDVELFRMADEVYEITEEPGEPIRFTLGASQEAVFELEGEISPNPSNPWQPGDVSIHMTYRYRFVDAQVPEKAELPDTPTLGDEIF